MIMMKSRKSPSLILWAAASIALTLGVAACNKNPTPDNSAQSQPAQTDQSQDPAAAANLAPASETQATGTNNQPDQSDSNNDYAADDQDANYGQPELQAPDPPPPLPEYSQPDCPGDGYLWTPGYWSYAPQGYYWVPGAWARPPEVGYL
ncbi:MAG: YXWGXW repeat-containing protein, partial [Candidatus Sulfotelmatobacter sp.]